MELSIVIPLYNEEESLKELFVWIQTEMTSLGITYEVIFVNDGSTDNSWNVIQDIHSTHKEAIGINFFKNFGKSQALQAGFNQAKGKYVVTMDADLQDFPSEIKSLYHRMETEHWDMISGWKKNRYDSLFLKKIPSKFYNLVARKVSKIKLNDFNCGLKIYRREILQFIELNGEMHRYIPILVSFAGFKKIGEQVVQHQARKFGETKFGLSRFTNGFLDLLTITFLNRFKKKPMHFFGLIGILLFVLGISIVLYLAIFKLFIDINSPLITSKPAFYIALITMGFGLQFFIAAFLGELIVNHKDEKQYCIKKTLN